MAFKVLLVGNYEGDGQESMLRFAQLLERYLPEYGIEVALIKPRIIVGRDFFSPVIRKWLGYIDKFLFFPVTLFYRSQGADIIHICDHSNAPYAFLLNRNRTLITCHDLLAVRGGLGEETDCPASTAGKILQRFILKGLKHVEFLTSDSAYTMNDIKCLVGDRNESKRFLIYHTYNYPYQVLPETTIKERLCSSGVFLPEKFLLHVGSNLKRKNREGVLRVFARIGKKLNGHLIFAGEGFSPDLKELAHRLGIADKVSEFIKPSNELLEVLYNKAHVMLFPSRFEGFGWPLIEAQACGCPVICSDCGPFHEIISSSEYMYALDDEEGMANGVVDLLNPVIRRKSIEAGLTNARRFSKNEIIPEYVNVYKTLLRTL